MKVEYLKDGSPDCPLVRLFAFTPSEVGVLRFECQNLAHRKKSRFDLTAQPWVESVGHFPFAFVAGNESLGFQKEKNSFEWILTPSEWEDIVDFLERFLSDNRGFQWLDQRNGIALLISQTGLW